MKNNGQTALSSHTDVAIFALPIIVPSEEVCDATKAQYLILCPVHKKILNQLGNATLRTSIRKSVMKA